MAKMTLPSFSSRTDTSSPSAPLSTESCWSPLPPRNEMELDRLFSGVGAPAAFLTRSERPIWCARWGRTGGRASAARAGGWGRWESGQTEVRRLEQVQGGRREDCKRRLLGGAEGGRCWVRARSRGGREAAKGRVCSSLPAAAARHAGGRTGGRPSPAQWPLGRPATPSPGSHDIPFPAAHQPDPTLSHAVPGQDRCSPLCQPPFPADSIAPSARPRSYPFPRPSPATPLDAPPQLALPPGRRHPGLSFPE